MEMAAAAHGTAETNEATEAAAAMDASSVRTKAEATEVAAEAEGIAEAKEKTEVAATTQKHQVQKKS